MPTLPEETTFGLESPRGCPPGPRGAPRGFHRQSDILVACVDAKALPDGRGPSEATPTGGSGLHTEAG